MNEGVNQFDLNAQLAKKLLSVKKKVEYLKKDTEGYNFKYASPELVLGTLNPLLNEAGLFLHTEVISETHERVFSKYKTQELWVGGKKEVKVVEVFETLYHLTLRFTWTDVDTGYERSSLFSASGINNDEQGQGSAQTYGERYFLLKTFNIPTGKDDPDHLGVKKNGGVVGGNKPDDELPWISDAQVHAAVKRIEGGEDGVIDQVIKAFRVSKANMTKLEGAKPGPIDPEPDPKAKPSGKKVSVNKGKEGDRVEKAREWFKTYEEPNKWIIVKTWGKKLIGDKAFKAKDADELVKALTIEELTKLSTAIHGGEE